MPGTPQRKRRAAQEQGFQHKIKAERAGRAYDRNRLEKKFEKVRSYCGEYEAEDIIRKIMGGRMY